MDVVISVKDLVNRFSNHVVHDGLNLDVYRGEILGVVGGSGSGKSVLLNTILGLNHAHSGSIEIAGRDITKLKKGELLHIQKQWGVLFQDGALFSSLTVLENISIPLREYSKLSNSMVESLALLKLKLVGLAPEAASKFPSELSGGMRKRAALARALALDPHLLFLDEPTAGLDPISAAEFDELLQYLQRTLSLTVVMITHDLDSLYTICDRIAVLVDKKMIVDNLENLLRTKHQWISAYFHGKRSRAVLNKVST